MTTHVLIPVGDSSAIGEARRAVMRSAELARMSETDAGRASIVATEMATNLVRHAKPAGGNLLVAADDGGGSVEIISIDTGPGMGDIARCFADGYSTAGTPGNGLGAVQRLSNEHDVFSSPSGTVLWCRVGAAEKPERRREFMRSGALSVPAPLETLCGDAWRVVRAEDNRVAVMVADGLGHGPLAADAAAVACKSFEADPFANPATALEKMHDAMGSTRGAAVAVAQIDAAAGKLNFAGIGNIAGTLVAGDGSSRGIFSHNGTIGHLVRKIQAFDYPWAPGSTLVLHSDGLQTRWALSKYAGLARRHPAVVAGVLFRDFRRGRDDATVVVIEFPNARM